MNVVWYQGPGVARCLGIRKVICQSLNKLIAVVVVAKDLTPLDTPDDDVVKCTGGIYAGFTRHEYSLAASWFSVNLFIYLWTSPFVGSALLAWVDLTGLIQDLYFRKTLGKPIEPITYQGHKVKKELVRRGRIQPLKSLDHLPVDL